MRNIPQNADQMLIFLKNINGRACTLESQRDRILQEINELKSRKEILSWDEIASAIAYPKSMSDEERVSGGETDTDKLLRQVIKVNSIYIAQMEGLVEELSYIEAELADIRCVLRCSYRLNAEERKILEEVMIAGLTITEGAKNLGMARTTLYREMEHITQKLIEAVKGR